jgi:nucleoside-diphosphate-sugar epimerase
MRVLVTGGAGQLGVRLCRALLKDGYEVRIFDLDNAASRKNVKYIGGKPEIVWGDITNHDSVKKALNDMDAVVHMAAFVGTSTGNEPPEVMELATRINEGGTKNLVNLIKEKGKNIPFIYTSSITVFGPKPDSEGPLDPDKDVPKPKGAYPETKFKAENVIKSSGIDYVILRLASLWNTFLFSRTTLKGMFRTSLNNKVEVTHPEDTALAIINAIKNFNVVKGNTLIVSLGPKGRILHKDRVAAVTKVLGLPFPAAERFNKLPTAHNWYDTQRSEDLLHYQQHTFDDCAEDYKRELARRYTPFFWPIMHYFIGPVFGKFIL